MNLSQQTIRNMTTEELLSAAETVECIDRLTFSYISEKIQADFEDTQDEITQAVKSLEEVEGNLSDAAKAFREIEHLMTEAIEDCEGDYQTIEKIMKKVRLIAKRNADEIGDWL